MVMPILIPLFSRKENQELKPSSFMINNMAAAAETVWFLAITESTRMIRIGILSGDIPVTSC
jgi:hypothetical protein